MKRGHLVSSIAVVALLIAVRAGQAQQIDPKQGLIVAKQICAQCHVVESEQPSIPAAGAPRFKDIANTPGMTETAFKAFFQTSHHTMPNVILTGDQMNEIIAYIMSLKN